MDRENLLEQIDGWYDEYEIKFAELVINYLERDVSVENRSEEIHRLILAWNFDNPCQTLKWIVDYPKTDKATALLLYWCMEPSMSREFLNRDEVIEKEKD